EKALKSPKRVVFAEADNFQILKAAQAAKEEGYAIPILLGRKKIIQKLIKDNDLELDNVEIIDPKDESMKKKCKEFGKIFFKKRRRIVYSLFESVKIICDLNYLGSMMVEVGEAVAMISGITRNYKDVIRPALSVVGTQEGVDKVAGMYVLNTKRGPLIL